jgi:hypothetical protein
MLRELHMEKSVMVIWLLCDVDRSRFAIHHPPGCSPCHINGYSPQTTDELSRERLICSFLLSVLFQKMMMMMMMMTVVPLYKVKPSLWLFV